MNMMKKSKGFYLFLILVMLPVTGLHSQWYFPPIGSPNWDTLPPSTLGWIPSKIDSLYEFLDSNNTKAFILLKDGRIVLEKYFGGHSVTSNWYWASAGKTLTAIIVGLAQQEGYLRISDTTSKYLGQGWTDCTLLQEDKMTIWHQLTMTSGLDDAVADPYCTLDTCLICLSDAGSRWAYHNAPYTLLDQVIENATGLTLNQYATQKVKTQTGMDGVFIKQGYNNLFVSTARSMARFGLLVLARGQWNGTPLLSDTAYYHEMVSTSQPINLSYGYLWWLNGKPSYMLPQTQFVFPGSMNPNAPADMFAAMGKNGQFINVVPSQNLVWIRMGDAPDNSAVPFTLNNEIWAYLNELGGSLSVEPEARQDPFRPTCFPNPCMDVIRVRLADTDKDGYQYKIYDSVGKMMSGGIINHHEAEINVRFLPPGYHHLVLVNADKLYVFKLLKL